MFIKFAINCFLRNKLRFGSAALALCTVIVMTAFAFSSKDIVGYASRAIIRENTGGSDVQAYINPSNESNFFYLNDITEDEFIKESTSSVYGYFNTFLTAVTEKNINATLCSAIIADFKTMDTENPFHFDSGKVDYLSSTEIIVSESFAKKFGVHEKDKVELTFTKLKFEYTVRAVAQNRGIFIISPDAATSSPIFLSAEGFRRIFSDSFFTYSPSLVTGCYMRLKEPKNIEGVSLYLKEKFDFLLIADLNAPRYDDVIDTVLPYYIASSIVFTFFCLVALTVLLRLIFAGEEKTFNLLRRLGSGELRIFAMQAAVTLLLIIIAGAAAALLSFAIMYAAGFFFFALIGCKMSLSSYLYALALITLIGFIALIFARPKKGSSILRNARSVAGKDLSQRRRGLARLVFKSSIKGQKIFVLYVVVALTAILLAYSLLDGIHLMTYGAKEEKFSLFVMSQSEQTRQTLSKNGEVLDAAVFLRKSVKTHETEFITQLFALDNDGYAHFHGGMSALTGDGCALSAFYAKKYNLKIGDKIEIELSGIKRIYTVATVFEDDFLLGLYIIININTYDSMDFRGYICVSDSKENVLNEVIKAGDYAIDIEVLIESFFDYFLIYSNILNAFAAINIIAMLLILLFICIFAANKQISASKLLCRIGVPAGRVTRLYGLCSVIFSLLAAAIASALTATLFLLFPLFSFAFGGGVILSVNLTAAAVSLIVLIASVYLATSMYLRVNVK